MPQRDSSLSLLPLLLGIALVLALKAGEQLQRSIERAKIERNRRLELEEQLEKRDQQLDGALARIHEMRSDEPAAGE